LVKEVIFEGESVLGNSSSVATGAIDARLRRGWVKSPDHRPRDDSWKLERAEMAEARDHVQTPFGQSVHQELEELGSEAVALGPARDHYRKPFS
jgi:hypothetical protein